MMASNLDRLRAHLGMVGGQQSLVLGQALKRLKEQEAEIDRLTALLDAGENDGRRRGVADGLTIQ